MPLTKERTKEIVKKFGKTEADTGKTEVQIALLTQRIEDLTAHLKVQVKDHHTRYGLLKLVGQRRALLDYLTKQDVEAYRKVIKELGIRK
jgi:small subunit ribosomal protein S15